MLNENENTKKRMQTLSLGLSLCIHLNIQHRLTGSQRSIMQLLLSFDSKLEIRTCINYRNSFSNIKTPSSLKNSPDAIFTKQLPNYRMQFSIIRNSVPERRLKLNTLIEIRVNLPPQEYRAGAFVFTIHARTSRAIFALKIPYRINNAFYYNHKSR